MKATVHKEVAEIGEKEIKAALKECDLVASKDLDKFRLGAFYLGNWMADHTQFYDSVSMASLEKNSKDVVKNVIKEITNNLEVIKNYPDNLLKKTEWWHDAGLWLITLGHSTVSGTVEKFKKEFSEFVEEYKDKLPAIEKKLIDAIEIIASDEMRKYIKGIVKFVGFYEHVYPVNSKSGSIEDSGKMPYGCFLKVFNHLYTDYYPHDHLDRPLVVSKSKPGKPHYAGSDEDALGSKVPKSHPSNDLAVFPYVYDNINITAARISDIDLNWAAKLFTNSKNSKKTIKVTDTDLEFNIKLAELGHALHQVEDFFAHSNFIEHAALAIGSEYIEKNIPKSKRNRFYRKLMSVPNPGWGGGLEGFPYYDSKIKSGYFDFIDTIISLSHLLESKAHESDNKVISKIGGAQKTPDEMRHYAIKLIDDTLFFIHNPDEAKEHAENLAGKKIKNLNKVWDKKNNQYKTLFKSDEGHKIIAEKIAEDLEIPEEIRDEFVSVIVGMSQAKAGYNTYKDVMTAYNAYKTLSEFIKSPFKFIKKTLISLGVEKVIDIPLEAILATVKEKIYDQIGANRVGCHSLLAKDHGEELLVDQAWACAKFTHWFFVHYLTRRYKYNHLQLKRCSEPQSKSVTCATLAPYYDWKAIVEFFLKSPSTAVHANTRNTKMTVLHVTKQGDTFLSLEETYKSTSYDRNFSWKQIADRNFNSADPSKINDALEKSGLGYKVKDGVNFAFKPGIVLYIPNQRVEIRYPVERTRLKDVWWHYIMVQPLNWSKLKKSNGWWNTGNGTKKKLFIHKPKKVNRKKIMEYIKEQEVKLEELKNGYSSSESDAA